ncbi:MAG: Uma2 family endonuclease [Chloroflexota bacterium]
MALPQQQSHDENPRMTPEDYLAFDRSTEERYEYIGGRVYAMAGASEPHNLIVFNLSGQLYIQLRKRPCKAYVESMRVQAGKNYVYPDIVTLCNEAKFADGTFDTLTNPDVLFEVKSPSTEKHDAGSKFDLYRRIDTLQEYLLVSQDTPHIAHYVRQENGAWLPRDIVGLDGSLTIAALDVTLALADVYEKVAFLDEDEA